MENDADSDGVKSNWESGLPLRRRRVIALVVPDVHLSRAVDLALAVADFLPLRDPAGHAADGEHRGKHSDRNAHRPHDDAGVEIDVRVELAGDEVIIGQSGGLELLGEV